jgi:cellulose synthase/poly-beta-1,6-N-acetylglucosamine synthase-like glycosyltransferase
LSGYKAGALNYAMRHTDPRAEVIAVIDADYQVLPNWLIDLIPAFDNPEVAIAQAPQDYRDGAQSAFKAMCMAEYAGFFHIGMVTRNERNAIIQHGTMTMVRRTALEAVEGWAEWCITEDAELGLRLFEKGYKAFYIPCTYGRGLIPDTFADFSKQRFRWAYGAVMTLRHHYQQLLGIKPSKLTAGQRYHFVAGWLPWLADGFNLLFNFAAIIWSIGMIAFPHDFMPPWVTIASIPLALFVFKVTKSFFLYRRRIGATLRQSIAAAIAGLALSHSVAHAIWTGFATSKLGFFRTPKLAQAPALIRAVLDVREEFLFALAFVLSAAFVQTRDDAYMLDVQVWSAVLVVQAVPYIASVLASLISAWRGLPAALIGPMREIRSSVGEA